MGSDGIDGNSDAAGGIIDNYTWSTAKKLNLNLKNYQKANNTYEFLKKTNSLIITGSTGTNVADILVLLLE